MSIISSIKNFFCEIFGIETKEEKEARVKKEQSLPQTGDEGKEASDEEKEEKEHQWEDVNEQVKFVCQGGKAQCQFCNPPIADLIATSTTISLQDKPFVTNGDKDGKINFNFTGVCMHPSQQKPFCSPPPCKAVISLGEWKDYSQTMIDDYNALMVKSTIPCMISGMDLKIIDSGQRAELIDLKPEVKRNPQITDVYWKENGDDKKNYHVFPEYPVTLYIETKDYNNQESVTLTVSHRGKRLFKGRKPSFSIMATVNENGIGIIEDFTIVYEPNNV